MTAIGMVYDRKCFGICEGDDNSVYSAAKSHCECAGLYPVSPQDTLSSLDCLMTVKRHSHESFVEPELRVLPRRHQQLFHRVEQALSRNIESLEQNAAGTRYQGKPEYPLRPPAYFRHVQYY